MVINSIPMSTMKVDETNMGQIGTVVLSKALNEQEQQGQQMVNMIQSSAIQGNPNIGSNFDAYV